MFNISNSIAYDGLMVYGTQARPPLELPESTWYTISGPSTGNHWIPAEGEIVQRLLGELLKSQREEDVFLIAPFREVVDELRKIAKPYKKLQVGTIHTVQGKEANVVILVLGGNPNRPGAKGWASEHPNLLNVAVSRAKRRLYVVGDREAWAAYPFFSELAAQLPVGMLCSPQAQLDVRG